MRLLFIILILSSVFISACSRGPGEYDTFAQCLTEKGATMYGTEWCGHCKDQKADFGSSFQYVNFVDCDKQKSLCVTEGVKGYPTWIINGELYSGRQNMFKLSQLTDCPIEE